MSTATVAAQRPAGPDVRTGGPSLARLTALELRKSVDTRAGRWLLISIAAVCLVIVVGVFSLGPDSNRTALGFAGLQQFVVAFLLPVVGILAVTGEWSQRSVMTTFALVPARQRITVAKIVAVSTLSVIVSGISLGFAFAAAALSGAVDRGGEMDIDVPFAATILAIGVLNVLVGVGFGMALMNSPVAIVLFFILPSAFTLATSFIAWFQDNGAWVDFTVAISAMFDGTAGGQEWARLGTSFALWGVLPILVGAWRISRREVN